MDHKKVEEAIALVGGRYKLTVLLQKRARDLALGATPLIPARRQSDGRVENKEILNVALQEVLDGLIILSPEEDVRVAAQGEGAEATIDIVTAGA